MRPSERPGRKLLVLTSASSASARRFAAIGRQDALQLGDKIAAGNDALADEYPAQPPRPKGKVAPSPEQQIAIPVDRRRLVGRANDLLAERHDQGDGGIDLVLGQLLAREDVVLGVAVPDDI